jgi:hypothetical protein
MKEYEKLRSQYPEYVSLEQLHKICKTSKRAARYLVVNNIVPSIDTGRKTWRYKIRIDDVIDYLRRRERKGSQIPKGALSSRCKTVRRRRSYSQIVASGQGRLVAEYFSLVYADSPDLLSTADVAAMTGLDKKTVIRSVADGRIKALTVARKHHFPKAWFLDYVASEHFTGLWSGAACFVGILGGFAEWLSKRGV